MKRYLVALTVLVLSVAMHGFGGGHGASGSSGDPHGQSGARAEAAARPGGGHDDGDHQAGRSRYLVAQLSGRNEVSPTGALGVGDPDGAGQAFLRVDGDKITFLLRWNGIDAPTKGHLHMGPAGGSGPVIKDLFMMKLPDSLSLVGGSVTITDHAVVEKLMTDPGAFYINLHNDTYTGGAIRGQLQALGSHSSAMDGLDLS